MGKSEKYGRLKFSLKGRKKGEEKRGFSFEKKNKGREGVFERKS